MHSVVMYSAPSSVAPVVVLADNGIRGRRGFKRLARVLVPAYMTVREQKGLSPLCVTVPARDFVCEARAAEALADAARLTGTTRARDEALADAAQRTGKKPRS